MRGELFFGGSYAVKSLLTFLRLVDQTLYRTSEEGTCYFMRGVLTFALKKNINFGER